MAKSYVFGDVDQKLGVSLRFWIYQKLLLFVSYCFDRNHFSSFPCWIKTGNRPYDYIATFVAILNIGNKHVYILCVIYYIILLK